MARLPIKHATQPAITVYRPSLRAQKLVYIAVANAPVKYAHGRSKIVYIGTTRNGVARVASSAAHKARMLLRERGVRSLTFYCVTCRARPGVSTWTKLERGLLLMFKEEFGEVPVGNSAGRKAFWRDEHLVFSRARLRGVIRHYSE